MYDLKNVFFEIRLSPFQGLYANVFFPDGTLYHPIAKALSERFSKFIVFSQCTDKKSSKISLICGIKKPKRQNFGFL